MDRQRALQLVKSYVEGWKESDLAQIIEGLSSDCIIIESHGPTYRGVEAIKKWVEAWIKDGSVVNRWDINSFFAINDVAVFEWTFECTVEGQHYLIDGASIVRFGNDSIAAIREYRTTHPPYEWTG